MLNITKKQENSTLKVNLEGRLDTTTSPQLEACLNESLEGVNELILDFEHLNYISSAGLRVLISAQKVMMKRDGMKLIHVQEPIMEVLEVTGFVDILTIE